MDLDPLRQDITAILEECYSRGMQLPYLFVAVSLDGKVMGVRFTEAEEGDGLDAQPIAGNPNALATMPMPLNVMIVDATGQATCALISGPGQVTFATHNAPTATDLLCRGVLFVFFVVTLFCMFPS